MDANPEGCSTRVIAFTFIAFIVFCIIVYFLGTIIQAGFR